MRKRGQQEDGPHEGPADTVEADGERWFAQIDTFVVGYSHYPGELKKGESFLLDGKKVMNHGGEQCGWLAKEMSDYIVAMEGRDYVSLNGEVTKPPNKFKTHIRFQIFATPRHDEDCSFQGIVDGLIDDLQNAKCQHGGGTVTRIPGGIPVQILDKDEWKRRFPDKVCPEFCRVSGPSSKAAASRKKLKIDEKMDALYEAAIKYEDMPELPIQFSKASLQLLEHQRKAVWFMVTQESCERASDNPVWKPSSRGPAYCKNVITGADHPKRDFPRGGILADEMGLGKTISCFALLRHEQLNVANVVQTLVVVPLSTLGAWQDGLAEWLPDFRVVTYHASAGLGNQDEGAVFIRLHVTQGG